MFGLTTFDRRNAPGFYNPFKEMEELEKAFWGSSTVSAFKTDIKETEKEFVLESELPGFEKSDISIDINDGMLTITAKHNEEKEEKDKNGNYIRRERHSGSMSRSFDISEIDESAISAAFSNGILEVRLPKKVPLENIARKIEIA